MTNNCCARFLAQSTRVGGQRSTSPQSVDFHISTRFRLRFALQVVNIQAHAGEASQLRSELDAGGATTLPESYPWWRVYVFPLTIKTKHVRGRYPWLREANRGPRKSSTCSCGACQFAFPNLPARQWARIRWRSAKSADASIAATSRTSSAKVLAHSMDVLLLLWGCGGGNPLLGSNPTRTCKRFACEGILPMGQAAGAHKSGCFEAILHSTTFKSAAYWRAPVNSSKTGTLARVLQATAQYSICGWGVYVSAAPSTTTSWSYAHQSLKAPEGKLGRAVSKDEQGSGVS